MTKELIDLPDDFESDILTLHRIYYLTSNLIMTGTEFQSRGVVLTRWPSTLGGSSLEFTQGLTPERRRGFALGQRRELGGAVASPL